MDDITEEEKEKFKKQYPKFYAAVFDSGDWFGNQLKIAALFIMSCELFHDYIEGSFESFFCHEWKRNKNGELVIVRGDSFKAAQIKYSLGKEKCTLFEAACNWFQEMGAVNNEDREAIKDLTSVRNDLAHQLFKILISEEYPTLDKDMVAGPLNLYNKVANWWICNIEASIMPEDYKHFDEETMKSATVLQVQILSMLAEKI